MEDSIAIEAATDVKIGMPDAQTVAAHDVFTPWINELTDKIESERVRRGLQRFECDACLRIPADYDALVKRVEQMQFVICHRAGIGLLNVHTY